MKTAAITSTILALVSFVAGLTGAHHQFILAAVMGLFALWLWQAWSQNKNKGR